MGSTRRPQTAVRIEVNAVLAPLPPLTQRQIAFRAGCLVRVFGLGEDQIEDFQQEATLRILEERHAYDPLRGSWSTFVRVVLDSWYKGAAKRLRLERARRTPKLAWDPADPTHFIVDSRTGASRAEFVAEAARLVQCLLPEMRELALLLTRHPICRVAEILGVDRGTVVRRIQNHLAPVFENLRNKRPD